MDSLWVSQGDGDGGGDGVGDGDGNGNDSGRIDGNGRGKGRSTLKGTFFSRDPACSRAAGLICSAQ